MRLSDSFFRFRLKDDLKSEIAAMYAIDTADIHRRVNYGNEFEFLLRARIDGISRRQFATLCVMWEIRRKM